MTTARCFGGTLDGRWQQTDGRKLLAPVMDWRPALTLDAGDPRASHLRVHEYTLQKFAIPRPGGWQWFHALIGPGFTPKMVKAWLDGWIEEADKLTKEAKMEERSGVRRAQAAAAKMQTRPGDKARAEVAELERRLENQAAMIKDLREERHEALHRVEGYSLDRQNLTASLREARAELKASRTVCGGMQEELDRLRRDRDNWQEIARIRLEALLRD